MNVDSAAERVYKEIDSYAKKSENLELTEDEQKEIFIGVLKISIREIATVAVVEALKQTKIAVDLAIAANLKERTDL
ncbi:hypothetical protein LCGC14_1997180 [marine sediment metagenome]|uniref:Uncharacterized protein n=1 Tax=marine sediment metagenome TaxID=412755 RepID=A0A0F9FS95_9ZZZZ